MGGVVSSMVSRVSRVVKTEDEGEIVVQATGSGRR